MANMWTMITSDLLGRRKVVSSAQVDFDQPGLPSPWPLRSAPLVCLSNLAGRILSRGSGKSLGSWLRGWCYAVGGGAVKSDTFSQAYYLHMSPGAILAWEGNASHRLDPSPLAPILFTSA